MGYEIDDPRKWRVSRSGFSIKTGWANEKRIIAKYPGAVAPLDQRQFQEWLDNAERICALYNATLSPIRCAESPYEAAMLLAHLANMRLGPAEIEAAAAMFVTLPEGASIHDFVRACDAASASRLDIPPGRIELLRPLIDALGHLIGPQEEQHARAA